MNSFFEIAALVGLVWIVLPIGFALFWSILKRKEPRLEEAEDALAGDSLS